MTRFYFVKLKLLLFFLLPVSVIANPKGVKWIGMSSQEPASYHVQTTGNIATSLELSVEVPGFSVEENELNGTVYQTPVLSGANAILKAGAPDLQKLTFSLQLPAEGDMEVRILSTEYKDFSTYNILPSYGNTTRAETTALLNKGIEYTTDAFFPSALFSTGKPYIVRNARAQAIQIYPFQYNPSSKVLRVYNKIVLSIIRSKSLNTNPLGIEQLSTSHFSQLSLNVLNKESSSLRGQKLPADQGRMLILCPNSFRSAMEPYAAYRNMMGINTEIISSDQFTKSSEIYDFVKKYYYSTGNLTYLLLVGDAEQIPPYQTLDGSSDNHYSYMAGADHYPDILVGRFSAETIKDVETQVKRTLMYEQYSINSSVWITTATGIASTLSPGDDKESDYQHVRNLLKVLKSSTYTTINEFYEGSQGEGDATGDPSSEKIIEKINQGTGVIFYTGHGSINSMATGGITHTVVKSLANVGKYPLIWAASCENGKFKGTTCIAETWLRSVDKNGNPIGAAAALMSSGTQTSHPPMEAQDKIADMVSNPPVDIQTMGAITVFGEMAMNDEYDEYGDSMTDIWILFGDPALHIRTAKPKMVVVDKLNTLGFGKTSYPLSCNVVNGNASINENGQILGTGRIINGKASINLNKIPTTEKLTLTITALNYLPYKAEITVTKLPVMDEYFYPYNHSQMQPINQTFNWNAGSGATPEQYLFYLGTDNTPTNIINGKALNSLELKTIEPLKYNTKYYWKVVAVNSLGKSESKVMDFTTIKQPDEDFETTISAKQLWNNAGASYWSATIQEPFAGSTSMRSGAIGNSQYSSLILPYEAKTCDFISFWSKTSSEKGDKLQFIIDNIAEESWDGETAWGYHSYKITPGKHTFEWRYIKDATGSLGQDAAWLDDIHFPNHEAPSLSIVSNGEVCENSNFQTLSNGQNYFSLKWKSTGDGSFQDAALGSTIYTPGIADGLNKNTTLTLVANAYSGCPTIEKTIQLAIHPLPNINLPADTTVYSLNPVTLDASSGFNYSYVWEPAQSNTPAITITPTRNNVQSTSASVTVTSDKGCTAKQDITIHFQPVKFYSDYSIWPNPSHGNFNLASSKGSVLINKIELIDTQGKSVWNNPGGINLNGSTQLSVPNLLPGKYYLVMFDENGRSVNPIIIQ